MKNQSINGPENKTYLPQGVDISTFCRRGFLYNSMKISGIYKIQSKIKPERCYIGSSMHISDRWWHHKSDLRRDSHPNIKLQRHCNKYGLKDLIFSIIEPCLPEFLSIREQSYFNPLPWFNISKMTDSPMRGRKHTEAWKKYMSERYSGINSPTYGRHPTLETRKKLSKSHTGKKLSIETRINMSGKIPWNKGKTGIYSEETRQKISKAGMHRIVTAETREKHRKAMTGRKLSQESKDKIGKRVREAAIKKHLKLIA